MEFNSHLLFAPQKGIFCFPGKVEVGIYLGILLPSLRKLEPFYHLTIFPSLLPLLVGKLLPSPSSGHQRMRGKAGCVWGGFQQVLLTSALQPPNLYDRSLDWASSLPPHWLLHELKPGCVGGGGVLALERGAV